MVTEGLPVGCTSCLEDGLSTRRPSTGSRSLNPSDGLAGIAHRGSRTASASSDQENGAALGIQTTGITKSPTSPSTETPPTSPRVAALQTRPSGSRRESSFGRTYDENDKKRAIPCENCALTLPRRTKDEPEGGGGVLHNSGPILRTRKAFERVAVSVPSLVAGPSPPKSDSSESDDPETETAAAASQPRREATSSIQRTDTSSSSSSFTSTSHSHYLDYTSTHEPLAPASFSIVRQSCLRTLSCETLPPSSTQYSSPTSPSPFTNNPFSTGPTGSTSSGGPIFFGDALAGYTTAYIFRIPDPSARGRRRVYALMALSTHRERLAMQTFSFLSTAFRELAAWIQALAEAELDRQEELSRAADRSPGGAGSAASAASRSATASTPTSSFLSGRSRGPDGKAGGMNLRARGLADLVGLPDFFIELHTHFVRLLVELGMLLGS